MAVNHKFGRVTLEDSSTIADDEPTFILAAHDRFIVPVIMDYIEMRRLNGASQEFLDDVTLAAQEIEFWQLDHGLLDPRGNMSARVSRSIEHRINFGDYEGVTIKASAETDCDEGREVITLAKLEDQLADALEDSIAQARKTAPVASYIHEWES